MQIDDMPAMVSSEEDIPLFVDIDGTLTKSDLLLESFLSLIRKNVFYLFLIPVWLFKGKANLKHQIAMRCDIDVSLLPYNSELLAYLEKEHAKGRRLILATASNERYAKEISRHFGIFDSVIASDGTVNLLGSNKLDRIRKSEKYPVFDYAGNDVVDLLLWENCRKAIAVSSSSSLLQKLQKVNRNTLIFNGESSGLAVFRKAMRIHQWSKNCLLFLPLLLSHRVSHLNLFLNLLFGFVAFGLCASSVYILNDLLDIESDRRSSRKKNRPFASGQLSILKGILLFPVLLAMALGMAVCLPRLFMTALALYFSITLLYSIHLKKIAILDVIVLASLYTLRIIAGAFAVSVKLSFWLLALSMFLFFSLALAKRYAELEKNARNGADAPERRGYSLMDMEVLSQLGITSGLLSVLVLALYINSREVIALYSHPMAIWVFCPILLYWVSRIWMMTKRGELDDDPVIFVLFDRISHVLMVLGLIVFWLAV